MNQLISLLLILILIPLSSYAQDEVIFTPGQKNLWLKENLQYKKKSISEKTVWRYERNGDNLSENKYKSEIIKLNSSGLPLEWEIYNVGRVLETIIRYSYDQDYNILKETEFLATGQQLYQTVYNYDENQFINEQLFYYGVDNLRVKIIYELDKSLNKIKETRYYPIDKIKSIRHIYFSDESMTYCTKIENMDAEGTLYYTQIFKWENNKNIEELAISPSGKNIFRVTNTFDNNNLLVKSIKIDNKGETQFSKEYKYNSNQLPIFYKEIDETGSVSVMLEYTYE